MLNYNQFEILTYIEKNNNSRVSQREISSNVNLALGTVNKTISELLNQNLIKISDNQKTYVTEFGYKTLEPYRVKRAIFLAAGFGSRMVPLTLNTPKPLIKVHGKRMIETLLDAVVKVGIEEIYIVIGYLGEQFEILKKKYPNINFIENKLYNEANNISSAVLIKNYLQNAYVLESDLVLYNENLIRKYEYHSNYLVKFVERTDDWCVETKKGIIEEEKIGGENCYQMIGISYYDSNDGKRLGNDLQEVFDMPGGKEKYWEQVQLVYKKKDYKIYIRECKDGDILELDTFNELKQIDKIYDC